jgi:hypothetical protein
LADIKNKDGEYMVWRYASNEKGSLNEEGAADYVRTVLYEVLGSPPSRDDSRGHQGVAICDGVGTHIEVAVLETAVELDLEVVLRVPHLSFRLQGEDTVNFSVLKVKILPHHIANIFLVYCDIMHNVDMLFNGTRRQSGERSSARRCGRSTSTKTATCAHPFYP